MGQAKGLRTSGLILPGLGRIGASGLQFEEVLGLEAPKGLEYGDNRLMYATLPSPAVRLLRVCCMS